MTPPPSYVLDCSVALAWVFPADRSEVTDTLLRALPVTRVIVPELFLFELANGLLVAQRRAKGMDESQINRFLDNLMRNPLSIERTSSDRAISFIRHLALRHDLTVYDATYLDLAIRTALPMATLDRRLIIACQSVGVGLVLPTNDSDLQNR
jgi:predicted nucleic acid-binding protein